MTDKKINTQIEGYLSKIFNGRISRINYLVGYLIVAFGAPIAVAIAGFPLTAIGADGLAFIPALIVWAASAVYGISFAVRRFHDIGRGGVELLWFLVPFVNIYFAFLMFFKAGDEKKNEYGPATNKEVNIKNLFGIN